MPLVATPAVVLHAFDYLESSRILRLLTRDAGVVSVLARGARRSRSGSAGIDLFAAGDAQLSVRPTRELQTLTSLDVTAAHAAIGLDLGRFAAASALAELALRFASGEANPTLYDAVAGALDDIAAMPPDLAAAAALRGAWRVVGASGFAPALDLCAGCHAPLDVAQDLTFSGRAGGALCVRCARSAFAGRQLPAAERARVRGWTAEEPWAEQEALGALPVPAARSHARLLREFAREHLADERPLRAYAAWEDALAGSSGVAG